jgi:hypothetical protein
MSTNFELLKRTYPISQYERYCDGYDYIMKNTTLEERNELDINKNNLQRIIKTGEKYIYQVAKENREFKIMCLSFNNYSIIRNKLFKFDDD